MAHVSSNSSQYESAELLHLTAQAAKEELQPELDLHIGNSETQRQLIGGLLLSIWEMQMDLGLPPDIPAVTSSREGKLLDLSVAAPILAQDDSNLSTLECMKRTSRELGVPDFTVKDANGVALHTIGDHTHFYGSGGTYNFGPVSVNLTSTGSLHDTGLPVREDYWSESAKRRSMTSNPVLTPDSAIEFDLSKVSLPPKDDRSKVWQPVEKIIQPIGIREYEAQWRNYQFDLDSEGYISKNDPMLKRLMQDLHYLAYDSVNWEGGPFAAAIIDPNGKIVAFGTNRVVAGSDAIAHGEKSALTEALYHLKRHSFDKSITSLKGYMMVTSSATCISCAEQAGLYGIKGVYYGNTKKMVELGTRFTEGPLHGDFWTVNGIRVVHVKSNDALEEMAFRRFREVIAVNSSRAYLDDQAQLDTSLSA